MVNSKQELAGKGLPVLDELEALWRELDDLVRPKRCERNWFEGLRFKTEDYYLTSEGYPMGTTCWYIRAKCEGLIKCICAATPEDAVRRTIEFYRENLQ